MHICADEIIAFTSLVTSVPVLYRFRSWLKARFKALPIVRSFFQPSTCSCAKCVPCRCEVCARKDAKATEPYSAETIAMRLYMEEWLANVAPILIERDVTKHVCRDGSGYLVAGRVRPLYPTPEGSDWYRDDELGMRLATAEESKRMREVT